MTTPLGERAYFPGDIEAATDGYCNRSVQHVWHARNQWVTPTDTPMGGKPRQYRLEHVYEAAVIAAFVQFGLTIGQARDVIMTRCERYFYEERLNVETMGEDRAFDIIDEIKNSISWLPEFRNADPSSPVCWSVVMGLTVSKTIKPRAIVDTVDVVEPEELASAVIGDRQFVILFNVTKIIVRVHEVLEERRANAIRAPIEPLEDGDQ